MIKSRVIKEVISPVLKKWRIAIWVMAASSIAFAVYQYDLLDLAWRWFRRGGPDEVSGIAEKSYGDTAGNMTLVFGAAAAFVLAMWRAVSADRQAKTSEAALRNERYQKGAEMLGSQVMATRIGGIYALEQLARAYPQEYHIQFMDLLCVFIRHPPHVNGKRQKKSRDNDGGETGKLDFVNELREDVQAALTAIGRRSMVQRRREKKCGYQLDLQGVNLRGAVLFGAHFERANLTKVCFDGAELKECRFDGASLRKASLINADLGGAIFREADMHHADLRGADLESSDLSKATLTGADLSEAKLIRTKLRGANLETVFLVSSLDPNSEMPVKVALAQTIIDGADFTGASMNGVDWLETQIIKARGIPQEALVPDDSSKGVIAEYSYNLFFQGYWQKTNRIPAAPGIFLVYACWPVTSNEGSATIDIRKLIYIGESKNARARVESHEMWGRWEEYLEEGEELCFNFSQVPDGDHRRRVEAALIYDRQPPANVEHKDRFPYPGTTVKTAGQNRMLEDAIIALDE